MSLYKFKPELRVSVGVLAAVTIVVLLTWKSEPTFQGRPLNAWFNELASEKEKGVMSIGMPPGPQVTNAMEAIGHFGGDAVPFLIGRFEQIGVTNRSRAAEMFNAVFARSPPQQDDWLDERRLSRAFEGLGEHALPAIPELEKKLSDPAKGHLAAMCLIAIKPNGMDAVIRGLNHSQPMARGHCAFALSRHRTNASRALPAFLKLFDDPEAGVRILALQGSSLITTNHAALAPELIARFSNSDPVTRRAAIGGLAESAYRHFEPMRPVAPMAVEALTAALSDSDNGVRLRAAATLMHFRDFALPALPKLAAMTNDPDERVRKAVTNTLGKLKDGR